MGSNADPVTRRGTIVLNDQRVEVTQAAGMCTVQLRQASASFSPAGGSGTIEVTSSSPLCTWTVSADAEWIAINSAPSGAGSASVRFTVAAATGPPRTATITIGGQRFSVVQSEGCAYSITPSSASVTATGGGGTVTVSTAPGCPWTAVSNASWIEVTQGTSGSGDGEVRFTPSGAVGARANGHARRRGNRRSRFRRVRDVPTRCRR